MHQHIVTAAAVKVSIGSAGGNRIAQFLRRGDVVPEGVVKEQLKRLQRRGLIAELPSTEEFEAEEAALLAERDAAEVAAAEAELQAKIDAGIEAGVAKVLAEREQADAEAREAADKAAAAGAQAPPAKAAAARTTAK